MTKLTLLAAAAAVLISSPVIAQERAHERRIPHRPDRPVSYFLCTSYVFEQPFTVAGLNCYYCTNNTPILILHSRVYERW